MTKAEIEKAREAVNDVRACFYALMSEELVAEKNKRRAIPYKTLEQFVELAQNLELIDGYLFCASQRPEIRKQP